MDEDKQPMSQPGGQGNERPAPALRSHAQSADETRHGADSGADSPHLPQTPSPAPLSPSVQKPNSPLTMSYTTPDDLNPWKNLDAFSANGWGTQSAPDPSMLAQNPETPVEGTEVKSSVRHPLDADIGKQSRRESCNTQSSWDQMSDGGTAPSIVVSYLLPTATNLSRHVECECMHDESQPCSELHHCVLPPCFSSACRYDQMR